ncbi:MAG: bestrophin family ion channel [Bacteroidota bacterium]|nr:bestrophin family ion channel [Bacteroidota bacterium]
MITYNPKDWFKLITQFHKSDTFRRLIPVMIGIGVFTAIIVSFEIYVFHWSYKNNTVTHSILGFVLSMLLVFRTNTAYERWWEGRKIWGDIVNQSRNLSIKLRTYIKKKDHRNELIHAIYTYNYIIRDHLLPNQINTANLTCLPNDLQKELLESEHQPNTISKYLANKTEELRAKGELTEMQVLMLNEEMRSFVNNCGACERIKNTPIPFSYNIFLKKIIFLYVMSIPFAFGPEFRYVTIVISIVVLYVFASIELIAEEIEDPFGDDDNDLPLEDICDRIKNNLLEIMK